MFYILFSIRVCWVFFDKSETYFVREFLEDRGRRTIITNAARKISTVGGSLRDVQHLAGHSSLQTTERYIRVTAKPESGLSIWFERGTSLIQFKLFPRSNAKPINIILFVLRNILLGNIPVIVSHAGWIAQPYIGPRQFFVLMHQ